ncbi:MAG: purine-nucleoside phosphorylase [Bacteroidales bacterium]|jgi:purine-nucleoside phosphorylase|nr:purine-nucleoside phosphorylase [Bacteroidales bacterium]
MSLHIAAKPNEIAPFVLLPGDPLRARFIAENILENARCYSEIRGMYGFTGTYRNKPVSVQGTGMGIPSISIYAHELICDYNVQTLVRIGTCGGFPDDMKVRDIVIAQGASTDSAINKLKFNGMDFAPLADAELLLKAYQIAKNTGIRFHIGNVLTSDIFYYDDDTEPYKLWQTYNIIAVEMEAAALYTLAARFRRKALAILTVSNHMITNEEIPAIDREKTFTDMVKLALELA